MASARAHGVPHGPDAEAALLGAALLNSQAATLVVNHTSSADFWLPLHRAAREAIVALSLAEMPLDVLSVATEVSRLNGRHDMATAKLEVGMLMASCPAPANAHFYLGEVHRWTRRRTCLEIAEGFTRLAELEGDDRAGLDSLAARVEAVQTSEALEYSEWDAMELAGVISGEHPDPEPTVLVRNDGACLLYPGKIHSVAGEPECGKSWIMLHACLEQMEAGRSAFYLDFEDDAPSVVDRLLGLGAAPELILERFFYMRPGGPLGRADWAIVARLLEKHRPAVVVIDGLTEALSLHGFDLNSNSDVANFLGLLPRRILLYGPAVVLIDHVVKNAESRGRYSIGAQHKLAGIHVAYQLEVVHPVVRDGDGLVNVTVQKDRPGHVRRVSVAKQVAELRTHSQGGLMTITLAVPAATSTGDGFRPTELMERVSRWLEINPGSSMRDVVASVSGKGAWLQEALRALTSDGHAVLEAGIRGAHLFRIVKPYRTQPVAES